MFDAESSPAPSTPKWPEGAELSLTVVQYGPDIPTEADLRLLGHLEGKRVLDLGCGTGAASVAMAKQGARVVAVAGSADEIASARTLAEQEEVKVELHQSDLAELAFVRADAIDAAISIYSIAAMADPDRVFRQVHRVLRPEAPLVLSLAHPAARASYFDRAAGQQTVSSLFTSLTRANFRVDTVLEPQPGPDASVPATLIMRARKQGI